MKILVITLISLLLFSCGDKEDDALTVVSFGGAYSKVQKKYMIDPFVKQTKIKVNFEDYSGGIAELRVQVESKNIQWDVIDIEYSDLERACSEGLLEVIPKDILLPSYKNVNYKQDFIPEAIASECSVGTISWATIFAYRNDLKIKPKTIADFFDIKKIPGKRGLNKRAKNNLEWALIADGVAKKDVYKLLATREGIDRAFKKLDTIKKDVIWFDSWSQPPQLLSDNSVVMSQSANGRIYDIIKNNKANVSIVWDSNIYDLDGWSIVRGTKKLKQALEFIKIATTSEALAGMQNVAYGPTRKSSLELIEDDVKKYLPSAHFHEGIKADSEFWFDNEEYISELFTAWLLQG